MQESLLIHQTLKTEDHSQWALVVFLGSINTTYYIVSIIILNQTKGQSINLNQWSLELLLILDYPRFTLCFTVVQRVCGVFKHPTEERATTRTCIMLLYKPQPVFKIRKVMMIQYLYLLLPA